MTTATADRILPAKSAQAEMMSTFSAWYITPWHEPEVSAECRAYVLSEAKLTKEQARDVRAELAEMHTVEADLCSGLRYSEAGNPAVREDQFRLGMRLLQRVEGERGAGTLNIWYSTLEQCEDAISDLRARIPWALAQTDARIDEAESAIGEADGQREKSHQRRRVRELKKYRARIADSLPDPHELQAFFIRFERLRLEATMDQRYKEQRSLEGKVDRFRDLEMAALAAVPQNGIMP